MGIRVLNSVSMILGVISTRNNFGVVGTLLRAGTIVFCFAAGFFAGNRSNEIGIESTRRVLRSFSHRRIVL